VISSGSIAAAATVADTAEEKRELDHESGRPKKGNFHRERERQRPHYAVKR